MMRISKLRLRRRLPVHVDKPHTKGHRAYRPLVEVLESRVLLSNWSGNLTTNTTWSGTQNIVGNFDIDAGVTLTIQAGTLVQFNGGDSMTVDGTLNAQGASGTPINFTSVNDNSSLGGSNTASPGAWGEIEFNSDSTGSTLNDVRVLYAGSFGAPAIFVNGGPLTLTNSAVNDNDAVGVRIVQSNAVTLTADTFASNGGAAVSTDLDSNPTITGESAASFSSNGVNGLRLDSGSLVESMTWDNPDIVYSSTGTLNVPTGKTLTIDAGQVLQGNGSTLTVDGTLNAQGTAMSPVIFTSYRDFSSSGGTNTAAAGDWSGIQLNSDSTGNVLNDVDVFYAGSFGAPAIKDIGASLTMTGSQVSFSQAVGLRIQQSNSVTLTSDTFTNNSGIAITTDDDSNPTITGETTANFSGNSFNGVQVDGGTAAENLTWNNADVVYSVATSQTLEVPVGLTLSISAGQIIQNNGTTFTIDGTLNVQGTAASPVIFTSYRDNSALGGSNTAQPGDWRGIQLNADSTANVLNHVEILYGGSFSSPNLLVKTSQLSLTDSTLNDSNGVGARIVQSNPTFTADTFTNNSSAAVSTDDDSNPTITGETTANFSGNSFNGVQVDGGTAAENLTWNNADVVYSVATSQTLEVPVGLTLSISAGQIIQNNGTTFTIDGTLNVQGTAASPVIFTSYRDNSALGGSNTAAPGDWFGIQLNADSSANVLNHVEVLYGGSFSNPALKDLAALTLTNSAIDDSGGPGMRIQQSNPTLTADTFDNNSRAAISMDDISSPTITGEVPADFSSNGTNGLLLDNGSLSSSQTWNTDIAYVVDNGTIHVPAGMTLTLNAGQVIQSNGGTFTIDGTLNAQGTAALPVIFTSYRDNSALGGTNTAQPGDWFNIQLNADSTNNVLNYVNVLYGGAFSDPAIKDASAPLTLTNSAVNFTSAEAMRITQANPTLTNDTFLNNSGAAISTDLVSSPTINNITATGNSGNGANGVLVDNGTLAANLTLSGLGVSYAFTNQVTIPQGLTLTLGQNVTFNGGNFDSFVGAGSLDNNGTMVFTSMFMSAQFNTTGAVQLQGGLWQITGGMTNTGTITLAAGAQLDNVDLTGTAAFGTVDVNPGVVVQFNTNNGGTYTGGTVLNVGAGASVTITSSAKFTGGIAFSVAPSATVDLTGGSNVTYAGTLSGAGGGTIELMNGTFQPGLGGVTLDFTGSLFQWTGGLISASLGNVTNLGTINLAGSSDKGFYNDGILDNIGAIIQTGAGNLDLHSDSVTATTLKNEAGALYQIESDSGIDNVNGGTTAVINAGKIVKSAGTGTSTLIVNGALTNTGTIEADSGTVALTANSVSEISSGSLTGGTWNTENGARLQFPNGTAITANQGNLTLSGAGAAITGISGLTSNSGSMVVADSANFTSIGAFTNSGSLTIGAGSVFTVTGGFTQSSIGILTIQIGGTPASADFGKLAATGAANLAGTLDVAIVNGFKPTTGQDFTVLTAGSIVGNFGALNGLSPFFTVAPTATALSLDDSGVNSVDLAATALTAPTSANVGQSITVNWQATNQSSQAMTGSWQDSVYLSPTPTITASSTLLGATPQTNVAADASYNSSLTTAVPSLAPGAYYVLVLIDSLYEVPDPNRANNVLVATSGPIDIGLPALTLAVPLNDSFTAANQSKYYQLAVPAGGSVTIALQSSANSGATALYVGLGSLPTPFSFLEAATTANQASQSVTIPQVSTAATYYVLARSVAGGAATASYTLTATQTSSLNVTSISSYAGGNAGPVTVEINGTNFTPSASAELSSNGNMLQASSVDYVSSSQIYATFNLSGASTGNYNLTIVQPTASGLAPSQFVIDQPVEKPLNADDGPLNVELSAPQFIRAGRTANIVITYANESNNDVVAPLLAVTSDNPNVLFSTAAEPNVFVPAAQLLAIASNGPAGILRPGQTGQLQLTVQSNDTIDGDQIPIDVSQLESGQTVDWASVESELQPPGIPTSAWNAIYTNLLSIVGSTTDSYVAALAQAATYLDSLGESTAQVSDITTLWTYLLSQADASIPVATLTSTVDASLLTPGGPALAVDRSFTSSLAGRSIPGIFGLGWSTSWQTSLTFDSSGNASINVGNANSYFSLQSNGTYLDTDGEYGTLTQSAGIYTYTDQSGDTFVFLPSGLLSYVQDTNNNRITVAYNGSGQPMSLTYSNVVDPSEPTEQIQLTYNAQGFVSQESDESGDTWTYTYDADGHLLSVVAPGPTAAGLTTSYTYDTSNNPQTVNALLSITKPDDSQEFFTYDSEGRLSGTSANGGQMATTYAYLGEGEVEESDSAGDQDITWYNQLGLPARVQDALGGLSYYAYDINGNLTSSTDPLGNTYQFSYDENGNLIQSINPLGQTVQMTYDAQGDMTSITDAAGTTTQYSYNSAGNLLSIAYPDGTQQSFTYDPLGNLSDTIVQNGDPIGYQYNAQGLTTQENFADGTHETFSYDAHGNMLTAQTYSSAGSLTGTTNMTYNAANQLTSVSYPGGMSLAFTYNAEGQRIQSTDQTGYTLTYHYDIFGHLASLSDGSGMVVSYTYNGLGEISKKTNGNGTYTTYSYDASGNVLNEINFAPNGSTNSSFAYTYNLLGETTSMTDAAGNITTYGYDALGQLTQVGLPGGATLTYVYDAAGNRTAVVNSGAVTNFSSNVDNEITQAGSTTYSYDQNGNLRTATDSSGTTTYNYNDLNQLVSITASNGTVTSLSYSPLGFMNGTTVNGTTTDYLVDPTGIANVVGSFSGSGSLIAHYDYGLGLVSQSGPSGTGYYDFDGNADVIGITSSSGAYVNQYSYLPFGETTTISAGLPNPFTYSGQAGVLQIGGNLFSMGLRAYLSNTGQFTSVDPLSFSGGDTNLRRYVGNSPVGLIDPIGLAAIPSKQVYEMSGAQYYQMMDSSFNQWADHMGLQPGGDRMSAIGAYFDTRGPAGDTEFHNDKRYPVQMFHPEKGYHEAWNQQEIHFNGGPFKDMTLKGHDVNYVTVGWYAAEYGEPLLAFESARAYARVFHGWQGLKNGMTDEEKNAIRIGYQMYQVMKNRYLARKRALMTNTEGHDPNALIGPAGVGTPAFIQDSSVLPYTIDFENDGSAATQNVTVTQQLDPNLDWSTFQLGSFGFGSLNFTVPAGLIDYETTVPYQNTDGSTLDVQVSLDFNVQTGLLTATFVSLDPSDKQAPTGVFDGFLYPESDSLIDSEGYVQYTVQPISTLATGATVTQQASVVFDTNAPLATNDAVNTIDTGSNMTSTVSSLPPVSLPTFTVNWSGADPNGSGIAAFNVYVSVNSGPFTLWQNDTTATSASYTGSAGNTYGFAVAAIDNVGNVQTTPAAAEASTLVKLNPGLSWSSPADIVFGTALGSPQLDATASVPGTFAYTLADGVTPANGALLAPGQNQTLNVTFTPTDSADYASATTSVQINVLKATPVITWGNPADILFGTALGATQLDATASVAGNFAYTLADGVTPASGASLHAGQGQTLNVTFMPTNSTDYSSASASVAINVDKATPSITWTNPADITYGTPLGAGQLDASASVAGTLSYTLADDTTPATGAILNAAENQTLNVAFTPTDATDYNSASGSVVISVGKATPTLTGLTSPTISFGTATTAISGHLNANADGQLAPATESVQITLNGVTQDAPLDSSDTFTTTFDTAALGVVGSPYSIGFSYAGDANFNGATGSGTLTVQKATPTIIWTNPADITFGAALGSTQLDAAANTAGMFTYTLADGTTPASGAMLNAGPAQTLNVSFSPTDTADFSAAFKSVVINVLKATPTITWADPADITYGTALGATQLDATANVGGAFAYTLADGTTPASNAVLHAGADQTLKVSFTPADGADYNAATGSVSINVLKATPSITWSIPVDITYGTPLGATQLDAGASVGGSFSYTLADGTTPASGAVLNAGSRQTLNVAFMPTDAVDYNSASGSVMINVGQATPTFANLSAPATSFGANATVSGHLNANAGSQSVPAAETVQITLNGVTQDAALDAGDNFTTTFTTAALDVAGSPYSIGFSFGGDTNFASAIGSTMLTVNQASQAITFNPTTPILYGSPLTLSATGGGSGNPVTFSVVSGPATLSGNTLTPTGIGSVIVEADQAGDANYLAAAPVQQTIAIGATYQTTPSQFENSTPTAFTVSTLLGTHYSDPDGTANTKPGIAIFQASGNGVWQYSTNGKTWTALPAVTPTQALLLPSTDSVRFQPATNASGSASLDFVAWDGSVGVAGSTANTLLGGGTSAFSSVAGALNLTVTPIVAWSGAGASLAPIAPGMYTISNPLSPPGSTIAAIFGSYFLDANPSVNVGVAISGVTGSGTWQYSTNGTAWVTFAPSTSNAYLLAANDLVRFVPKSTTATTATLTAYAWDGNGSPGNTVNLTKSGVGGSTGFSATSITATAAANRAPTLSTANVAGTALAEDATGPAITVSSLLTQAGYSDADGKGLPQGIAITATSSSVGAFQYMLSGGAWQNVPAVSMSTALLLPSTASVRLVGGAATGMAPLTFAGWDQTQGAAGQPFDITATGGATAFSTATSTLSIAVENAAPSWSASTGALLTPILPGMYTTSNLSPPPGNTVGSIVGSFFRDLSPGVLPGVAIVAMTGIGTWQFSTSAGTTWMNIPAPSLTSALLLTDADWLRFVPRTTVAGSATLTVYAWDRSVGTHGQPANLKQLGLGGTSAFSATPLTVTCAVNSAPTLMTQNVTLAAVNENVASPPITAATLLKDAGYADPDGKSVPSGVAITGDAGPGAWQWLSGTTWTALPSVSSSAGFLLPSTAQVRFKPADNLAANTDGSATLTYLAWDQTAGSADSVYSIAAQGGASAFSSASAAAAMTINFVKQSPSWTAGVSAAFTPVLGLSTSNPSPNPAGDTVAAIFGAAFFDTPGTPIGIAISAVNTLSAGAWQYFNTANSQWTSITASMTSAILLTANTKIRFLPSKAFSGTVTLTAYAWDGTGNFSGTANLSKAGLGGMTPFSATSLTATCVVNSAPMLSA